MRHKRLQEFIEKFCGSVEDGDKQGNFWTIFPGRRFPPLVLQLFGNWFVLRNPIFISFFWFLRFLRWYLSRFRPAQHPPRPAFCSGEFARHSLCYRSLWFRLLANVETAPFFAARGFRHIYQIFQIGDLLMRLVELRLGLFERGSQALQLIKLIFHYQLRFRAVFPRGGKLCPRRSKLRFQIANHALLTFHHQLRLPPVFEKGIKPELPRFQHLSAIPGVFRLHARLHQIGDQLVALPQLCGVQENRFAQR